MEIELKRFNDGGSRPGSHSMLRNPVEGIWMKPFLGMMGAWMNMWMD